MEEFTPLPHNLDAEEYILGALLLDPQSIDRVSPILSVEAFYASAHQKIYQALITLHQQGKTPDLIMVSGYLKDHNLLELSGGKTKLVQLANTSVSSINVDGYANLVLEKFLLRRLIDAGHEIVAKASRVDDELEVIFDQSEQAIWAVTQSQSSSSVKHISEAAMKNYEAIEERAANPEANNGFKTGFYDLDAMTKGLQPSDLIILAARPSMGKTALALNIAHNLAKAYDTPVLAFSLEMSDEQLSYRLLSSESGIPSTRLRAEELQKEEYQKLSRAIWAVTELPIYIDDSSTISVTEMRSRARQLQAQHGKLGLILLDYLQLMGGDDDKRVQELSKITRGLKTLARELEVPILVLSQLSRGVEQRTNKRPCMSDLRDSGSIEQDADIVMMLYREAYYDPNTPERDRAELIIGKHRNGPTGTVNLLFNNELTEFRNLARSDV